MTRTVTARPLTREAFAPFGEVIEMDGAEHFSINAGKCERYHDLAKVEATGPNGRVIVNLFRGQPYATPLNVGMVERHPFGSQAFIPLSPRPFLVVVCADDGDRPGELHAFITRPGQGVNYPCGRWHGVLTPLGEKQDFVVVDRGGDGSNVEEFFFEEPWEVRLP